MSSTKSSPRLCGEMTNTRRLQKEAETFIIRNFLTFCIWYVIYGVPVGDNAAKRAENLSMDEILPRWVKIPKKRWLWIASRKTLKTSVPITFFQFTCHFLEVYIKSKMSTVNYVQLFKILQWSIIFFFWGGGRGLPVGKSLQIDTLQIRSDLCVPRNETARPRSQFPHSCICIQIHDCRNWGTRPRSFISGNICFEFSVQCSPTCSMEKGWREMLTICRLRRDRRHTSPTSSSTCSAATRTTLIKKKIKFS